jgi:hypothetical protein
VGETGKNWEEMGKLKQNKHLILTNGKFNTTSRNEGFNSLKINSFIRLYINFGKNNFMA